MTGKEEMLAGLKAALAAAPADPGGETVTPEIRTSTTIIPEDFTPLPDEFEDQ